MDLKFFDCFTVLGLTQWVNQSTFLTSGNILDIVLSSEGDRIGIIEVMPPFFPVVLICQSALRMFSRI